MADEDYIGFSIKAEKTPDNRQTFTDFFTFAKMYTRDDYTTALRFLLESWEQNKNLSMLYEKVVMLEERIVKLESTPVEEQEEDKGREVF